MAARTIEAKLVISGEDHGASAAINKVVQAVKQMEDAAKVAKPLQDVARSLHQVEQASKAVEGAMKARTGFTQAEAGLKATREAATATARALDEARKARAAYDGVKAAKGSEQAAQIQAATKAVRELSAAHRRAEGDVRKATAAVEAQVSTMERADAVARRAGADLSNLEGHQRKLRATYEETTAAIMRQVEAQRRANNVGGTMSGAGRAQLDRIESGRRVAAGMSAPAREAEALRAQAEAELAAIRATRVEAAKVLASGAGIYIGHKAGEARQAVTHTYAEFDDLIRYQTKVADLTPAERRSRMNQAVHLGGQTSFNDIQVLETQLTLAQRGVKKDFVEPFTQEIVNYAQAMNTTLPEAAKTLEGVVFSTNQHVEDANTALSTMRKNVDMLVKTAKVGGLQDNDLKEAFKFGGASGTGAGLSPQTMGAIFATLHRVGYAGSEAGVATRAIAARLVSPTGKGRDALDALGIDYSKFSKMPDAMSGKGLGGMSRRVLGKDLNDDQMARVQAAIRDGTFTDDEGNERSIVEDQGRFTAAISPILLEQYAKNKKGQYNVKDTKDVAKLVGRFHQMSVESIDSEGLLAAILAANPTMAQANALFSEKHGGKVTAMARKLDVFKEVLEAIQHVPEGFAKDIGDYRMQGFSGQMKRYKNTRLNVETAVGRGLDNDGDGAGGLITSIVRNVADLQQHIAELNPQVLAAGSALAYFGGKLTEAAGTVGLLGSALALTRSAAALNAAAVRLGAPGAGDLAGAAGKGGALKGVLPALGAAGVVGLGAAGIGYVLSEYGDPKKAIAAGGKQDPGVQMNPGDELPGLSGSTDAPSWAPRAVPSMTLAPGAMPLTIQGSGISAFGLNGPTDPATAGQEAGNKAGKGVADGIEQKAPEVEGKARGLFEKLKSVFSEGIFVPINFVPGTGCEGGLQNASFGGGGGGGGFGGLIHRASLGGGGLGGGGGGGGGGPVPELPASVQMTDAERNTLGLILRHESGGRNVMNYVGRAQGLSPGTARGYTAQGYFQMLNSNWRRIAPRLGIRAPNAMAGSLEDQTRVALHLLRNGGIQNWSNYNPALRNALRRGDRAQFGTMPMTPKDNAALDPRLVKGADGREGLDLGNGTMRMPDGSVRPIPKAIPEPPPGGFGSAGRGGIGKYVEDFGRHVDRLSDMGFHGEMQVSVSGPGASQVRVSGFKARGRGGMRADMGISMPGVREDLSDWS